MTVAFSESFEKTLQDDYGVREASVLRADLKRKVERALVRAGAPQGITVTLTIVNAKPNRPTFAQMSDKPGLSFQSFGIGGAAIEGQVLDADGKVIAALSDRWYETDINQSYGRATWGDANFAFDRFARKLAKAAASG
jgi:hypothetical protein